MDAAASSGAAAAAAAAAESSCTAARWDALPPDFVARLPAYVQRKKEEKGRAAITPYKNNSLRNFALACRAFRDAKRTHVRNIAKIVDIHFARLRELLDGEKAVPQKAVQDVVWNTRSVCSYEIETSGFWLHTLLCASDEDEVRQVVQRNPYRVFYLWLRDVANRIANSKGELRVHALDLCELSVDTSIARPLSPGGFPLPRVLQDICVDDGHGRGVRIFLNAYTERGEFVSCAELSLHWTAPGEARAAYNDLELEYHSSFNGRGNPDSLKLPSPYDDPDGYVHGDRYYYRRGHCGPSILQARSAIHCVLNQSFVDITVMAIGGKWDPAASFGRARVEVSKGYASVEEARTQYNFSFNHLVEYSAERDGYAAGDISDDVDVERYRLQFIPDYETKDTREEASTTSGAWSNVANALKNNFLEFIVVREPNEMCFEEREVYKLGVRFTVDTESATARVLRLV